MKIDIEIAEGNTSATLMIRRESANEEFLLGRNDLEEALNEKGVIFGIKYNILEEICVERIVNKFRLVAEYQPPGAGQDARIKIFRKPLSKSELSSSQSKTGEIDYILPRAGFILYARKGDVLAEKQAATRGTPGMDIFARPIPGRLGNDIDLELSKGPGTIITDERVLAEFDGIIHVDTGQISITNQMTVQDNIGINTGSIDLPLDLNAELHVEGDIKSGYYVNCSKIVISGTVEDARITAGELFVKEGIAGTGTGEVIADKIEVGYINGTRKIRANVLIVHREISGGAEVYANVVRAFTIRGSFVAAKEALWSDSINGRNTIVVGLDYEGKLGFDEISKKIADLQNPIEVLKEKGLLNSKKMKKLSELARINPRHPLLKQELPKIREAKVLLDNYMNLRAELIQKREEIAHTMYSQKEPFMLVQRGFSNDNSAGIPIEPNILITMGEHVMKVSERIRGGMFTFTRNGIMHSVNYNIKEMENRLETLQKEELGKSIVKGQIH